MGRIVLPLIAGLFLGVAVGFVLFGTSGVPAEDFDSDEEAWALEQERSRPDGPSTSVPVEPPAEIVVPPAVREQADRIVREVARPDAATGSGSISGQVEDQAGKPVVGALVRAQRRAESEVERSDRGVGEPNDRSLDEELRRAAERYYERTGSRREATTDAEGRFVLEGLLDGKHDLQAWARGYIIESTGARGLEPGGSVDFIAKQLVEVRVKVLLPDGRVPKKAALRPKIQGGRGVFGLGRELWTPAEPTVLVPPGRYEMNAYLDMPLARASGLDQELTSDEQEFVAFPTDPTEPLTFQLRAQVGIRGRLIVPKKLSFDNAIMHLMEVPLGQDPDLEALASSEKTSWTHRWNPEYSFLDLKPGTYAVGVAMSYDSPIVAHAVVRVTDRVVQQNLELPAGDPENALVVRVLDSTGEGVSGVQLFYAARGSSGRTHNNFLNGAVERQRGEYLITPDQQMTESLEGLGRSEKASFSLTARSEEHGSRSEELQPGQREVTIRFDETATLIVTVAGYTGSGLEGQLSLSLNRDKDRGTQRMHFRGDSDRVRADGTVELGPMEAGSYTLSLSIQKRQRYNYNSRTIARQPAQVVVGENRTTIVLPPLYTLTVRFPEHQTGSVRLRAEEGYSRYEQFEDGVRVFEHVPAGAYTVELRGRGSRGTMKVNVPAQTDVTFRADPMDVARVSVKSDDGWLAQNGFQNGDIIVAFAGQGFGDRDEMKAAMMGCLDVKDASVTVLRGGKQIEMPFDVKGMMQSTNQGGSINSATR